MTTHPLSIPSTVGVCSAVTSAQATQNANLIE
jgi:hypothetical protein